MLNHQLIGIGGRELLVLHLACLLEMQRRCILAPGGKSQGNRERAHAPDNFDGLVLGGGETALDVPQRSIREPQQRAGIQVDATLFLVQGEGLDCYRSSSA